MDSILKMINILGLFHVGCCCQCNITCGFETSHNFARLALCRDLNMRRCEGFVFYFGCNLQNYLLNREPREFGFKRVLVDSFHFQNHNSCSSSYDASKYNKMKYFRLHLSGEVGTERTKTYLRLTWD